MSSGQSLLPIDTERLDQTAHRWAHGLITIGDLTSALGWRGDELIAKGAQVTAVLFFNYTGKIGASHATRDIISDNITSGIDAKRPRQGRSRVMDRGVGLSGF